MVEHLVVVQDTRVQFPVATHNKKRRDALSVPPLCYFDLRISKSYNTRIKLFGKNFVNNYIFAL